ncbi:MAG TPA: NAD-binding protein, partial [bacterium]
AFVGAFSRTVNILSNVGLGDYPATNTASTILVIILEIGSVGIVAMAIATLSEVLIRGAIKQYLGRYRMDERINKLTEHFIVVGYSLTGETLVQDLQAEQVPFVVVEQDPEKISLLEAMGILFVEGDGTDEKVLETAGIARARGLFATLSSDSDNLMVVLSASGMNRELQIVSKVTREDFVARFQRAGADVAISPQEWASKRMINSILRPHLLSLLHVLLDPTHDQVFFDESRVPFKSPLVGKSLAESGIRENSGIAIIGIARMDGEMVTSPSGETELMKGDVLIGYGVKQNFNKLHQFLKTGSHQS